MRLGEFIALRRQDFDGEVFTVAVPPTKVRLARNKNRPRRSSGWPCCALSEIDWLSSFVKCRSRIDSNLLFPTPTGKLWRERNFYEMFVPGATGDWDGCHSASLPTLLRLTQFRAAGIDDADLADVGRPRS